ncbi:hypothetical protein BBBOND_0108130 [Babesia bigemina]|uniref:CPW-WPC domain-containing protein n=1 Tax=Babesia bigemina TaxID=5866 RepID=A0A061D9U9_BABBI|nr:hypothetical protein BBBOND_0108130 [Babesia bigemina]CDR94515.1 hypothetical protein BBBOND_0108130 [Babesia bigemina]|eukprot:XP_012766701.1 hypothetical protein BBBOND_0108130 [Babesia bigemina]
MIALRAFRRNDIVERWTESPLYSRVCEAPISYFGPCATLLPSLESRDDKERMEKECRINWPCYNQCEQAYDAKCPKFWQHENGLCMPTPAYHGPCAYLIDLSKLQTTERVLWSNRCGVTWPCKPASNDKQTEKMQCKLQRAVPRGMDGSTSVRNTFQRQSAIAHRQGAMRSTGIVQRPVLPNRGFVVLQRRNEGGSASYTNGVTTPAGTVRDAVRCRIPMCSQMM